MIVLSLCKNCNDCKTYTYQRTIERGKNKGMVFKFDYCKENSEIVRKSDWTPGTPRGKLKKQRIISSKFRDKRSEFSYFFKEEGSKDVINFIDGNTLNAVLKNMQLISRSASAQSIKTGDSVYPGVSRSKIKSKHRQYNKWQSKIKIDGETEYLGIFDTELQAAHAYYRKCEEIGRDINYNTDAYSNYRQKILAGINLEKKEKEERTIIDVGVSARNSLSEIKMPSESYTVLINRISSFYRNNSKIYKNYLEKNEIKLKKYKNVSYDKKAEMWRAMLYSDYPKKLFYFEMFNNEKEAVHAVEEKRKELDLIIKNSKERIDKIGKEYLIKGVRNQGNGAKINMSKKHVGKTVRIILLDEGEDLLNNMKESVEKTVRRFGTSGGVTVTRAWLGKRVLVIL